MKITKTKLKQIVQEEMEGLLAEQDTTSTFYVISRDNKVIGSFNSSRPKGEKFLPNKTGEGLGHTAGPHSPGNTTMVDNPRELGGFDLNESSRQLKQIIIEESQVVIAEKKERQRERTIMLAEAKRIDALHEISLSGIANWAKEELPHLALDVAGLVPGFGEGADLANAGLYLKKGEYFMAALSVVSMVPGIGDIVGKGGKMLTKFGGNAGKASKHLGKLIGGNMGPIKKVLNTLKDNPIVGKHVDGMLGALVKYADDAAATGAKAGEATLKRLQQALKTAPVKPVKGGTLKKLAAKTKVRKDREKIAGVMGGQEEEEEAAE